MILESTIGGIVGGVFRMAPELLKAFDRKNERAHELAMLSAEMQFAAQRAEVEMKKIGAAMTMAENDAIVKAIQEQGETARAAGWFVAAVSALVRPVVTYWMFGLYNAVKVVGMWLAVEAGAPWKEVLVSSWTEDDMALLVMVLTFWFIGRVYERNK